MPTRGRTGDRRATGRGRVPGGLSLAARFRVLLASKGIFAFEARSNTNNGTNVQTFVDLIDPTRVITVTGTLPKPATTFCTFSGTQSGLCNKPALGFAALHDGTGMETRSIVKTTSAAVQVLLTTRVATAGYTHLLTTNQSYHYVVNATAGLPVNGAPVSAVSTVLRCLHFRFSSSISPNYTNHATGTADVTGAQFAAPSAGAPQTSLMLGSDGTNFFLGDWHASYGFLPLTDAQRALVDAYTTATFGIANP